MLEFLEHHLSKMGHRDLLPRNLTGWSSNLRERDLESELKGLLPYKIDLLLSAPLLAVFCTFVDVTLAILQHSIHKPCEAVRHGSDGFGGAELGSQPTILSAKISPAF